MSIGPSGRVVVEIDIELKRNLHAVLREEGMSLRDWFISEAEQKIERHNQGTLDLHFHEATGSPKHGT